jgi:hypothetical protein
MRNRSTAVALSVVVLALTGAALALAGTPGLGTLPGLTLAQQPTTAKAPPPPPPATTKKEVPAEKTLAMTTAEEPGGYGYKGVSNFFNIREANSNVKRGEWSFEAGANWFTYSNHRTDEVEMAQSIKYGFTNEFHIELEVAEPLGTAGDGVGETYLTLFYQVLHETDCLPALAFSAEGRFPSGHGSSKIDGTLFGHVTKTLFPNFRAHFQAYVMTANGERGDEDFGDEQTSFFNGAGLFGSDEAGRRAFQWGGGPGFDYEFCPGFLGVMNYLHKVSDEYGQHNNNILELGIIKELGKTGCYSHEIKLAADVGLDGQEETPNLGAKLLYEIEW